VLSNPSFQKAVSAIKESIQHSGGYRQAVKEIYTFKHGYTV
jgi:hypothetical protein